MVMAQRGNAELVRDAGRFITAGVVGKNDIIDDIARDFVEGLPQGFCRVIGRQHHDNALTGEHWFYGDPGSIAMRSARAFV